MSGVFYVLRCLFSLNLLILAVVDGKPILLGALLETGPANKRSMALTVQSNNGTAQAARPISSYCYKLIKNERRAMERWAAA
jgi:hypothetical protein